MKNFVSAPIFLLVVVTFLLPVSLSHAATINSSSAVNLSKGLVGYWTFDGKDTNWATGKTNDLSGQGNTGQLISMSTSTSPVVGKIGQGLRFDGTSNYVEYTSNIQFNNNDFTVAGWFKLTGDAGGSDGDAMIFVQRVDAVGNANPAVDLFVRNTDDRLRAQIRDNVGAAVDKTGTTPIAKNVWYHGAMVKTSSTLTLYLNGVNDGSASHTLSGDFDAGAVYRFLGKNRYSGGDTGFLNGTIDDVRIYNRALSASEIAQLYKQGAANVNHSIPSISKGLVGYWTLDGKDTVWTSATAGTTKDLSGNNNTGTLTSMNQATTPVMGKIGQALKFNGVNNYVSISDATNLRDFTRMSIAFWANPRITDAQVIVGKNYTAYEIGFRFGSVYTYWGNGTVYNETGASSPNIGKWNHFVWTLDVTTNPNTWKLYKNGVLVSTQSTGTQTTIAGGSNLFLGTRNGSGSFDGVIDDVRVYNRALSAKEVQMLYSTGATNVNHSIPSISKGLVGYWTFDGNNTNWATGKTNDLSGQGNTGQLISMSTTTSPVAGKIGQGFNFFPNGADTNSYITMGNASTLNFTTGDFSVSVWTKNKGYANQGSSINAFVGKMLVNSPSVGYRISYTSSNLPSFIICDTSCTNTATVTHTVNVADNKWHLITAVKSGTNINIAVDGIFTTTVSASTVGSVSNSTAFVIDDSGDVTGVRNINGLIDDVRVYNRALSASEIKQLYNVGR